MLIDDTYRRKLKAPPYSTSFRELRRRHNNAKDPAAMPNIPHVFAGSESWKAARTKMENSSYPVLLLPPDANPRDFNWLILRNEMLVMIIQAGEISLSDLRSLALVLIQHRVNKVLLSHDWVEDGKSGLIEFRRKEA